VRKPAGQSTLQALIAVAVVAGVAAAVPQISATLNKQRRINRVKAVMTQMETKVRMRLDKPGAFAGCDAGLAACALDPGARAEILAYNRALLGADCAVPGCGVRVVSADQPGGAGNPAQIVLRYEGRELRIKDVALDFRGPAQGSYECNTVMEPLFSTLQDVAVSPAFPAGKRTVCRAPQLSPGMTFMNVSNAARSASAIVCPVGQVATGFDVPRGGVVCTAIPNRLIVTCSSADEFIASIRWSGNNFLPVLTCESRKDPWSYVP